MPYPVEILLEGIGGNPICVKSSDPLERALSLMIEHDLDVIFDVTEQLSVLHFGKMIAQGSTEEIRNNKKVKEVYLGEA